MFSLPSRNSFETFSRWEVKMIKIPLTEGIKPFYRRFLRKKYFLLYHYEEQESDIALCLDNHNSFSILLTHVTFLLHKLF